MKKLRREWTGWFSAEIPADWRVNQEPGLIELVPPDKSAAIHFSLLNKQPSKPNIRDAERVLENFAQNNGLKRCSHLSRVEIVNYAAAWASFELEQVEADKPKFWELCCVVWVDAALRASCCHDDETSEIAKTARALFRSIERA